MRRGVQRAQGLRFASVGAGQAYADPVCIRVGWNIVAFAEDNYKFLGASIYQRALDKPFAMPFKKYPLIYIFGNNRK